MACPIEADSYLTSSSSNNNDVGTSTSSTVSIQQLQLIRQTQNIDVRMKRHPELQPYVPSERDRFIVVQGNRRPISTSRRPNQGSTNNSSDVTKPKKCVSMTRLDQLAQPKRLFTKTATSNSNATNNNTSSSSNNTSNSKLLITAPSVTKAASRVVKTSSSAATSNAASTPTSMITGSSSVSDSPNNSANTSATASLTPSTTSASISTSISKSKLKEEEEEEEDDGVVQGVEEDEEAEQHIELSKHEISQESKRSSRAEPSQPVDLDATEEYETEASTLEHDNGQLIDLMTPNKLSDKLKEVTLNSFDDSLKFSTPTVEPKAKTGNGQQDQESLFLSASKIDQDEEKRIKAEEELREAAKREQEQRQSRQLQLESILAKVNKST